ncbi:MAG: polyprenyl synthetase family protein [Bacteroidales bacterium]|nr:polyprenyl synthetase family protein [Bacteroidales bacterium]MCF8389666.1 polyprenyl synthetase family protein [Bacteroidales bacterium]
MSELKIIQKPIEKELKAFELHFKESIQSKVPFLASITNYILRRKGKQIRPTLVLLSSAMIGGVNKSSYTAASLIELLHTASLVHDDVVDEAYERRGYFSLKAIWGSKVAVLVGDFLLSQGLLLAVEKKEYELLGIASEAVREMVEGELLQIRKSRKLDISMDEYFEVIRKKTAALIAACTATGAKASGGSEEDVELMRNFGYDLGCAFQIKDDLFDYEKQGKIGKPVGNDIKEKKMTLPLIYSLQNCTKQERRHIIYIIRRDNKNKKRIEEIFQFVNKYKGLEYAEEKMIEYKNRALDILKNFPDNESKYALTELVNYTIKRKV